MVVIVNGIDDPMIATSCAVETLKPEPQGCTRPVGILGYWPVQELDRGDSHLLGQLGQVTACCR